VRVRNFKWDIYQAIADQRSMKGRQIKGSRYNYSKGELRYSCLNHDKSGL